MDKLLLPIPDVSGQNLMPVSQLKYNLHDSQISEFSFGPRREVTLTIVLDPVWNENKQTTIQLRFSAIENFEEIKSFFNSTYEQRLAPNAYWDEIQDQSQLDKEMYRLTLGSGIVDIVCKGYQEVH